MALEGKTENKGYKDTDTEENIQHRKRLPFCLSRAPCWCAQKPQNVTIHDIPEQKNYNVHCKHLLGVHGGDVKYS